MAYTATKITENFTSYTASETGLYVFTGSSDGGYSATIGGTCEVLYSDRASGTVGIIWAKNGDTITVSNAYYNMLTKINGFNSKPKVTNLSKSSTATASGKTNKIYIGCATVWAHYNPGSMNISFSCTDASITTISHSNAGWSKNATSLIIPSTDNTITASASATDGGMTAYIFQIDTGSCQIKVNGAWKEGKVYVKNGTWKDGELKIKVSGAWKGAI